ncbi:uncharacterized protein LOC132846248 isoform X1 [Tachysurus vachellii]|uniref:uncharacterized protein LOC132846248 isoform X1 n=2 Tax=Tachysurus vachellii TaxID=175792 RepID=UPI00296ADB40|nr:uncharacterized protein LOC132846248 isoform X1 [Tachysurus vachellii]XP_060726857.1 uncharacterized protein LOC132846248 isoform X1 [Tachysurus vachellii]
MELDGQSVNDLFVSKGDLSLTLEHVAPAETALDHTVQDITEQIIGLGEEKLDLYVPSEAIIEPISPAEIIPEESALVISTYESTENSMTNHPYQSNVSSDPVLPNELVSSSISDSNPSEATEDSAARIAISPSCDLSLGDLTSAPTAPGETGISKKYTSVRKFIPPKKDRMDPLKMDMSKPTVIPLTSSQFSLQCLECHIIFSDDKSKRRHLKMNHPTEYEQCMLGDALFACYVCDRHFTCSTELLAHQRAHTEKQPFKCPICGEAFSRSSELTSHKKVHYNKQGYTCSDCGKHFKTLTLLKYHQRVHTGERPYVCLHKECGKRFTMPKSLQKHLEAHEKEELEGVENLTTAKCKTRIKRSMGSSTRKYACLQCSEYFKTAKSMVHHNKTKHSQCLSVTPSNSAVAAGSPCVATLTEVVQLPLPHLGTNGQAAQQISTLEVEQIKRLIEKMGNVQKVNQLVILGLDQLSLQSQNAGIQPPQGLMQPLHFDFTQPTVQQTVLQPVFDRTGHEGTTSAINEQETLLKSLEVDVAVEQNKTEVQGEPTVSAECPEKQVTVVESNRTGEQENDVQYEPLPELTGQDILRPQLEASHTTEEQQCQQAIDVKTPETGNDSCLTLIADFESRVTSKKATDITVFENVTTNSEPSQMASEGVDSLIEPETQTVQGNVVRPDMTNTSADPLTLKASEGLCSSVEPEPQTGKENLDQFDQPVKTSDDAESQCQKEMEATDSVLEPQPKNEQNPYLDNAREIEAQIEQRHLSEILSSEDQVIKASKPSLCNGQHDQDISHSEHGPYSESSVQQSRVDPQGQTDLGEDFLYIQKKLPIKKKSSKKQVKPKSQYLENQDEVAKSALPITPNKKIRTGSKTPKKQEKTKKRFGSKQNKKKYSKKKLLNISKASLYNDQQDTDPEIVSHNNIEKLKQKCKKGRKAEKSPGIIQALKLPGENKMKVSQQADRGKPQKRKFENQRDLVKKGKCTQETQQEETSVPKKKKPGKITGATSPKKAKDNIIVNKVNKKSHKKLAKQRENEKNVSDTPVIDQIKQQALLLLKGHKQPQLKVHKLDAKTTGLDHQLIHKCQTKEIHGHETTVDQAKVEIQNEPLQAPSQRKKKEKTLGKKSKLGSKQSSPLQTSIKGDIPSGVKQKVARKRKASAKIDQEIALSPPFSRIIIGCHDCGKSYSEVSALQEHMASMHSENGAHRAVVPCDVEMPTVRLRPNEIMLTNAVHSSGFEINVPTDWDVESEMREIGLGDKHGNEHRLSFPALNPSPSFPTTTTFVEEGGKQVDILGQDSLLGHKKAVGKNSACHVETTESKVTEQDVHSFPPVSLSEPKKIMEEKEALPSAVNLVRIEEQNGESSQLPTKSCSSHNVSDPHEGETSHNTLSPSPSCVQNQLPTKPVNPASTYTAGASERKQTDIKQEADEIVVQTVASQTNTSMTKGKRGRGSKGRGKRQFGKRRSAENRHTEETAANEEDCQVVFELYSLTDSNEEKKEEILKNRKAVNATAASVLPVTKDSSQVPDVYMLPQPVTANDSELMTSENGSLTQTSEEHDKNSSSSSLRKERISVGGMSGQGNLQSDNGLSSAGTSTVVKIEASPSVLTPHDVQANDVDLLQGVQMILVKAEDQQISNDPQILQEDEAMQIHLNACLEKHPDRSTFGISSGSPTVSQSTAKHCIFYPVKEEEREMLVEPQVNNQGTSGSEVLEDRTGPWGAPGLEESEIRIGCAQMEMHHNLFSSTEESSVGAEQQSTEDVLEFLSHTSDMEDTDSVNSEPEAETHILSCYHGVYSKGIVLQCETASLEQHAKMPKNAGCPEANDQPTGCKGRCEPIDYFVQYFSWSLWKDIAACTQQVSKSPKPVTEKEVAQFVGIHIAMGTLKFPCMKLYWDDFTRVPLIADAMSAAMFSELASNLRLASLRGDRPNWNGQDACKDQNAHNCTDILVSKKDPLWKVQAIVNRVREGCQALKRNGNYGVDQYLLPFQRNPTHSLHHTVMINAAGLVMDFNLRVGDCNTEEIVEKMVSRDKSDNQGVVFLCKPELSTPSMLEHLLEAGVRSAGKVGGARGQIGDEFVTSDGKLKLFRCHHGFILSAVTKERSRSTSLVSGFERAIKAANLNRDLRSLYRTPCTSSSPSAWPQSVLWDLIDLTLVNSWLQYKQEQTHQSEPLSLMAFRLEVSKALIRSSNIAVQDSSPPYLPPPVRPGSNASTGHSDVIETPLPDAATRYDGLGHWPEQLSEGEESRCRFGGCQQMSRVRCLKCCVFLCISRHHNCFIKFHSQGTT